VVEAAVGTARHDTIPRGARPVGLWLVEDGLGWEEATAARVVSQRDPAVFEIDRPDAWAELCRRFPLEVTASRRHDWYRTTGRDGRWVQPDWSLAAEEFDAVHLTLAGYLSTAGRAIDVGGGAAGVLAGWDPDRTFWLADGGTTEDPEQPWRKDENGRWVHCA
jgi:hypothetical protein